MEGSRSPVRVVMSRPGSGPNDMDVSTGAPSRSAVMEHPEPSCRVRRRPP